MRVAGFSSSWGPGEAAVGPPGLGGMWGLPGLSSHLSPGPAPPVRPCTEVQQGLHLERTRTNILLGLSRL